AYWYSTENGNMISSTYYFSRLPDWVERFNERRMADSWLGASWNRLLPNESEYIKRAGKDDVPWENLDKASNDTNYFPHVLNYGATPSRAFYRALDSTPYLNELLVAFTEAAITSQSLGADADTDVLTVSFSANDYVGHRFGPFSQEAMDMSLRVDRQIGTLLDYVDARVGLRNTIVVFTSDHGVAPVPEHDAKTNLSGRRFRKAELLRIIQDGLVKKYARKDRPATDYLSSFKNRETSEAGFINGNVYLNRAALKRDGIDVSECERFVGELAAKTPGVARYFTRTQLERGAISATDAVARRVLHGFHSQRSGDVILIFERYKALFGVPDDPTDTGSTATHGSPYSYDTHVPLIMMGRNFSAGNYSQAATPADIAPILARILKIPAPSCSAGRILWEALPPNKHGQ
ncbi:MAG: alkaline phosphatase family protein, partial [Pyrinomonadaceae bacterium]